MAYQEGSALAPGLFYLGIQRFQEMYKPVTVFLLMEFYFCFGYKGYVWPGWAYAILCYLCTVVPRFNTNTRCLVCRIHTPLYMPGRCSWPSFL
jgi:hypothetical protein